MRILDNQRYWSFFKAYVICYISLVGLFVVIDAFSNMDEFTKRADGVVEMIEKEAKRQHFDPAIAVAVGMVESSLNQDAVGKAGEIGCFQVLPRTVPPGTNLFDLKTNIYWGIRHLKYWQRVCPTVEGISFVNCYNSGFRHPRYPFLRPYVRKVASVMRRNND